MICEKFWLLEWGAASWHSHHIHISRKEGGAAQPHQGRNNWLRAFRKVRGHNEASVRQVDVIFITGIENFSSKLWYTAHWTALRKRFIFSLFSKNSPTEIKNLLHPSHVTPKKEKQKSSMSDQTGDSPDWRKLLLFRGQSQLHMCPSPSRENNLTRAKGGELLF